MGLLTPWSHVPHMALSYTDNMSFSQRWYNTIVSAYDWFCRRYEHLPGQNELIKKHFAHLEPLPSVDDLINNVSLILVNSHRSVSPPRPAMPGVYLDKPFHELPHLPFKIFRSSTSVELTLRNRNHYQVIFKHS